IIISYHLVTRIIIDMVPVAVRVGSWFGFAANAGRGVPKVMEGAITIHVGCWNGHAMIYYYGWFTLEIDLILLDCF
ncbi:hypothetical protein Tco_1154570, partial [Tanacetum coccineum]